MFLLAHQEEEEVVGPGGTHPMQLPESSCVHIPPSFWPVNPCIFLVGVLYIFLNFF